MCIADVVARKANTTSFAVDVSPSKSRAISFSAAPKAIPVWLNIPIILRERDNGYDANFLNAGLSCSVANELPMACLTN